MAPVSFQIMSDLHLETHPSYDHFTFEKTARYLALLGDIGHIQNEGLFSFLEIQLSRYTTVFFLLGNHEPYHMSIDTARSKMRAFESKMNRIHAIDTDPSTPTMLTGRFVFLDKTRHDLDESVTILGCTLFSRITPEQGRQVSARMMDFKETLDWDVDAHNLAHEADLSWLNAQVSHIEDAEPHRQIVIFTHHSPTVDKRAVDPKHRGSEVSTAFSTDLSSEPCWRSRSVRAWAFGHTHFNCSFRDEEEGREKVVFTNQKGYYLVPETTFHAERVFSIGE
ncbi:hypothetical protein VTN00DRAFT_2794 [Thermoascus crustaceus]|uniref:uncharacterized protein n=1 Tax=Thermoascus crustaceus TaxID=5088 RepID=UPI0037439914